MNASEVDAAILAGEFDRIPKTLSVADASEWWLSHPQTWRDEPFHKAQALLRFVRGGLDGDEIARALRG